MNGLPQPIQIMRSEIVSITKVYGTLGTGLSRLITIWMRSRTNISPVNYGQHDGPGRPRVAPVNTVIKSIRLQKELCDELRSKFGAVNAGCRAVIDAWKAGQIVDSDWVPVVKKPKRAKRSADDGSSKPKVRIKPGPKYAGPVSSQA